MQHATTADNLRADVRPAGAFSPTASTSLKLSVLYLIAGVSIGIAMGALALHLLGHPGVVPALVAAEFVAAAGVLVFAAMVFRNVAPASRNQ